MKTIQAKYGKNITNPMHVQSIKDKQIKTNIERYNVPYTFQSKE